MPMGTKWNTSELSQDKEYKDNIAKEKGGHRYAAGVFLGVDLYLTYLNKLRWLFCECKNGLKVSIWLNKEKKLPCG